MSNEKKLVGMVGLYDTPDELAGAAVKVRDAKYQKWDCHTPYPLHGLDDAMGLKPSPIPYITLSAGFVGISAALLLQGWMSAVDYPVRIGGKPMWSWPAFVPITFELFVLFSCVTIMGCVVLFCKLGKWHSPLHDSDIMKEVTSTRFAVVLDSEDSNFTEEKAQKLLEETGCKDIRPLHQIVDVEGGLI